MITNIPQGRLTQWKMICIKDLVDSKLFKLPECRAIMLPVFCQQIKDKLESKEEVCSTGKISGFLHHVFCFILFFLVPPIVTVNSFAEKQ